MTNQNDIEMIAPDGLDFEQQKKEQGKKLMLIVVAMVLVIGGLVFYSKTLSAEKTNDGKESNLSSMMPVRAKNKETSLSEKYGSNYKINKENSNNDKALSELTGTNEVYKPHSNEYLNSADFEQVDNADQNRVRRSSNYKPRESKRDMNIRNQSAIIQANRSIAYDANPNTPLYKKSKEELAIEREAALERRQNALMYEKVINGLDKASSNQNQLASFNTDTTITNEVPLPRRTKRPQKNIKPYQEMEIEAATAENTIGKSTSTGFYSFSTQSAFTGKNNKFITAFIHGNGEGVKLSNGADVKIRIEQDSYISYNGQKYLIPRNFLLSGIAQITKTRLKISVNSIFLNGEVIPVNLIAYDMDGVQGLNLPNMKDKNALARELTEAGSRPLNGPVWSQGGFGQQVGTQLTAQAAQSLIQGGSQYLRSRASRIQVSVKPNYKILLSSGTNQDETEIEN